MNIEQIFEKRLDRNINGVVKAEQTDDASAWIELDEYVITRELEGHLRHFFESYVPATGPERIRMENKIGVWVSGFFGSGKSHFIKILSYLLSNRKVSHNGTERNAYSFFEDKIKDALFLADINKAVHHPTEVILFNIDSRANVDDKEDAILKVFLKVFNERVGYCADFPHIAHLERELAKRGQYDAFKTAFSTITGSSWEKERDSYYFISDEMAEALSQATGQSVDASRQWVEQLDKNFPLDINNFCQWVKEWLDKNGKNILFMVDEVGQFIGKNTQMMLKLQTITENLGVICGGRAWVIVTSQADINAAIGGMSSRDGQDFSKIQGRFSTRLQLSSSNTSEVIQKRLLVKTDAAKPALAKVWQEKGDILRNQLAFDPTTTASLRPYTSEEEFIDNYPFVPWHYQILQKVFESIRTKGAAGKQLAMGERSQLEAFQTAAQQIAPQGLDSLVPFWRFYAAIESFLEPAVSRTITQACQNGILDEFDGNLLKTLFLIRYVDVLKSTLDNLVTLSIDKIDADKVDLRRRVETSLNKLEREMLIARVEDKYVFLTNEEKEIENEIRNVEVDFSAINKKLASIIFDDILKNRKYRYPANKQDFDISRFLNGHPLDGAMLNDLVVKILTPKDPTYTFYNSDAACRPYTSEGDGCILIRLPDEGRTWTDIDLVVQTEKFLKDNAGQRPEQASLLSEKARENSVREKMLRVQLESLIAEADVWAIGERLPKKSSTPSSIVDEACRYVIENTFAKLKMLKPFNGDIAREIHALLTVENDTELDLGELEESNPEAMREVESWVSMNIEYNKPVYLRDVLNHFARRPYGWPEEEVKLLVARLARKGKFSFSQQNNNIERKQVWELFNNSRRHSELRLHKIRRHDESQIRKAAQTMAEIAQQPFSEREEPALVEHIRQVFDDWKQELNVFRAKAEGGNNPGKEEIESGLRLLNSILSEKEDFALIEKVTSQANELLDFSEDREDLVDFYRKQFATWQKLGAALNGSFKSNRSALEKDAVAVKALGELESIWQMPEPYKHLNRITPLIEQVQNVNHQLVEQHRQHALERIDARIEESRQRLQEAHSTSELQNSVLLPMQKARKRAEVSQSIPEILAEQQETMALQTDAEKKINQWIDELRKKQEAQLRATSEAKHVAESQQTYVVVEKPVIQPVPKKTHLVNVASEMRKATGSEVLETAEQVEKALDKLRSALLTAIEAGDRIRLQ
ncbi:TPA: BREX system P-loop protein BrxC [Klebsiella pneumoniae]|uniref:BREX system P-loop protein BrxC n=1 Tax=Klebsiella pneumoniae TaxID=573 RepID=UPI000CF6E707|nr:BREX system P-loop protein BrxC [Klebsiella pneumoniae]PPK01933.1 DNA repair protein [Klebsiella pneumoniae]